jgi:hypothetical protein
LTSVTLSESRRVTKADQLFFQALINNNPMMREIFKELAWIKNKTGNIHELKARIETGGEIAIMIKKTSLILAYNIAGNMNDGVKSSIKILV